MRKKSIFSLAAAISLAAGLWAGLPQKANGQSQDLLNYDTNITPSVEPFKMSKYGNIEPSLNTGAMHTSIPIFTYKDSDFEIPLTLEYNYDGFKPAMASGTVGLGWHLNVGGVITRDVRGVPDEQYSPQFGRNLANGFLFTPESGIIDNTHAIVGGLYTTATPLIGQVDEYDAFHFKAVYKEDARNPNLSINLMIPYYNQFRCFDAAPDVFHFNAPGISGDFMMDTDGSFRVFNTSDVPEYFTVTMDRIYGFSEGDDVPTITIRAKGYTYVFGADFTAIDFSYEDSMNDAQGVNQHLPITAWHLSSITAPNGRKATFSYVTRKQLSLTSDFICSGAMAENYSGTDYDIPVYSFSNSSGPQYRVSTTSQYTSIPHTVSVAGAEVYHFYYATKSSPEFVSGSFDDNTAYHVSYPSFINSQYKGLYEYRLSELLVLNSDGAAVEDAILTHKYSSSNVACPKMFLQSVRTNNGRYSFDYKNSTSSDTYPKIDCKGKDHWGYWNAETYGINIPYFIPISYTHQQDSDLYNISGTHRNAAFSYASYGAMTRITYPTGGTTGIDYEPHDAGKVLNRTINSLGLLLQSNLHAIVPGGIRVQRVINSSGHFADTVSYSYSNGLSGNSSGIICYMPRYALTVHYKANVMEFDLFTNTMHYVTLPKTVTAYGNQCDLGLLRDNHICYSLVTEHYVDGSYTDYRYYDYQDYPNLYSYESHQNEYILEYSPGDVYRTRNIILQPKYDLTHLRGRLKSKTVYDADGNPVEKDEYTFKTEVTTCIPSWHNVIIGFDKVLHDCTYSVPLSETHTVYENGDSLVTPILYAYNDSLQLSSKIVGNTLEGEKYYYQYVQNHPTHKSCISKIVKSKLKDGSEYVVAAEDITYQTATSNLKPSTIVSRYFSPVLKTGNTSAFSLVPVNSAYRMRLFSYDNNHKIVQEEFHGGGYNKYTWDEAGRNITQKKVNSDSNAWLYEWKDMVGPTKVTEPSGMFESYQYDSNNRLTTVKDSEGNKTEKYEYNLLNE